MTQIEAVTRKWGNSLGITLPKEFVDGEHLQENQRITIEIKKAINLSGIKGLGKFSKSTQDIKNEMRKGWNKW